MATCYQCDKEFVNNGRFRAMCNDCDPETKGHKFGVKWGMFWWNYDLCRGASFVDYMGHDLRWYGIVIPWTNIGIGVMIRFVPKVKR